MHHKHPTKLLIMDDDDAYYMGFVSHPEDNNPFPRGSNAAFEWNLGRTDRDVSDSPALSKAGFIFIVALVLISTLTSIF